MRNSLPKIKNLLKRARKHCKFQLKIFVKIDLFLKNKNIELFLSSIFKYKKLK